MCKTKSQANKLETECINTAINMQDTNTSVSNNNSKEDGVMPEVS